ncbi:SPFH domain-containing protein [Streptomyces vilmorinianum]|uniref:SPFH domain-containing protein n=1 Tax=Streptomyces vilmorinianum TaxID=3051092 RepID=UPI0020C7DFDF|nr:SPFH domain-containing protein [Streptomyces vilmorinianum]
MNAGTIGLIAAAVVVVLLAMAAIKIVPQYERGVIFRLGRLIGAKGPGLFLIIPIVDRIFRVSLRTVTMDIPSPGRHHQRQRRVRVAVGR